MKKNKGFGKTPAPNLARAHAYMQAGHWQEAQGLFEAILSQDPRHPQALEGLGNLAFRLGHADRAIPLLQQALRLGPQAPGLHYALGVAHAAVKLFDQAMIHLQQAQALNPSVAEVYFALGNVRLAQEQPDAAVTYYRIALRRKPGWAQAHHSLADALWKLGQTEATYQNYAQAIALEPRWTLPHFNLGIAYANTGRFTSALECFQRVIQLEPDHAQAHFEAAHMYLKLGQFREGWAEYEWRWQGILRPVARPFTQPLWSGQPLTGMTILLHTEQGLGDGLQFIRYAPLIKAAQVIVEAPAALLGLFADCAGIDHVIRRDDPLPPFDYHVPLMSLPRAFGTAIPNQVPYLRAPATGHLPQGVQTALSEPGCKVGLVWAPSMDYPGAYPRHCPLVHFEEILGTPGVRFFSLYKGQQITELEPYQERIVDVGSHCQSFQDTAWAVERLDLVISVDTSVAHLVGALGKPIWILLPWLSEFRWLLDRSDSPWYPTARLFRQPQPKAWTEVLTLVKAAFTEWLGNQGIFDTGQLPG